MHRTQILLDRELHRRATKAAKASRTSLGAIVRNALTDYLDRTTQTTELDAVEEILLAAPFEDSTPDRHLSSDVDHYLYGAPRRSRRRPRPRR